MAFTKIFLISLLLISSEAWAQKYGAGGPSSSGPSAISETQGRRSAERFNIIDWIRSNNETKAAQDSKYGRGGGGSGRGPYPDFVLNYAVGTPTIRRDGDSLGKYTFAKGRFQFLLDDLFATGSRTKSLNTDLGFEVSYSQGRDFLVNEGGTQSRYEYKELSGALLIRPIGRSSQDSGLILKAGYTNIDEQGWWYNTSTPVALYAPYFAAEAKLYLLPFLGLRGDYEMSVESQVGILDGKWKQTKTTYGAFLELYLLNIEAFLFSNESSLTPNIGAQIKDLSSGMGFSGTLFF